MMTRPATRPTAHTQPAMMRPMARSDRPSLAGSSVTGTRMDGCAADSELSVVPLAPKASAREPSFCAASMAAATSSAVALEPVGTTTTAPTCVVTPSVSARARRASSLPTCSTTTWSPSHRPSMAAHSSSPNSSSSTPSRPSRPMSITTMGSAGRLPSSSHRLAPAGQSSEAGKNGSHTVSERWHGPCVPGQQPLHMLPGPLGGKPPCSPVAHLTEPDGHTEPYS
mmetsp:Transcript_64785/g.156592  ORF Transcript_64785/g.156592 Transcript_64785/m.156592 type:complete len:225 (+) Transcript_64785:149-823(+)